MYAFADRFLHTSPIRVAAFLALAGNNQSIGARLRQQAMECADEVFKALVRCDSTEKQDSLLAPAYIQSPPCLICREIRVRKNVVDAEWNNRDPGSFHPKVIHELLLHFFRMNEDVLGEMVLNAQGEAIEEGIVPIPLTYIYIVCCEDNPKNWNLLFHRMWKILAFAPAA